ncbi:MAG: hypothetical protein ACLFPE_10080 [Bacteroidales bacterium]
MKKAVWIIVGIIIIAALLYVLLSDAFATNFLMVFSLLYLAQFLIALIFISILDKSRTQLYLPIYFIVGIISYIILFVKLI